MENICEDVILRSTLNKMRDSKVSIQQNREMLMNQQIGNDIMMSLKNELMSILTEDS